MCTTTSILLTKTTATESKSHLVITECAGYIFWQFFAATITILILISHQSGDLLHKIPTPCCAGATIGIQPHSGVVR